MNQNELLLVNYPHVIRMNEFYFVPPDKIINPLSEKVKVLEGYGEVGITFNKQVMKVLKKLRFGNFISLRSYSPFHIFNSDADLSCNIVVDNEITSDRSYPNVYLMFKEVNDYCKIKLLI